MKYLTILIFTLISINTFSQKEVYVEWKDTVETRKEWFGKYGWVHGDYTVRIYDSVGFDSVRIFKMYYFEEKLVNADFIINGDSLICKITGEYRLRENGLWYRIIKVKKYLPLQEIKIKLNNNK